jgi:hypothetical protein
MGIFSRLAQLIKSNLNDLISKSEDPEKMLNQVVLDAEAGVHQRLGVQLEQLLEEAGVRLVVSLDVADVHPKHHEGRVHTQRGRGHVVAAAYQEGSGLVVDRRKLPVHLAEVRFYVVDASHGSRVGLRSCAANEGQHLSGVESNVTTRSETPRVRSPGIFVRG